MARMAWHQGKRLHHKGGQGAEPAGKPKDQRLHDCCRPVRLHLIVQDTLPRRLACVVNVLDSGACGDTDVMTLNALTATCHYVLYRLYI